MPASITRRPSGSRGRTPLPGRQEFLAKRVIDILDLYLGVPRQAGSLPPPLDMLIATVLSQNTNDKNSHRAYRQLRDRYPTWEKVAAAPLASLKALLKSGGMANQKSHRIKEILATVKSRFGIYSLSALRMWTNDRVMRELTTINGIGPKTAACVLLFSLGRDIFPVDTHVHRLCRRLGLSPGSKTPEETFERMKKLVPAGKGYAFHTNLIRFGRKVCRSNTPACQICPLYELCIFEGKKAQRVVNRSRSVADHDFMVLDNVS
jgi:endonuclease-3